MAIFFGRRRNKSLRSLKGVQPNFLTKAEEEPVHTQKIIPRI